MSSGSCTGGTLVTLVARRHRVLTCFAPAVVIQIFVSVHWSALAIPYTCLLLFHSVNRHYSRLYVELKGHVPPEIRLRPMLYAAPGLVVCVTPTPHSYKIT